MADVTISQLTQGVPAGNNIIPYSTGSDTLGVAASALLQNAGNIGIGTNNPVTRLTVNGDSFLNYTNSSGLLIRNLTSENRIDSYNYPITQGYPLALLGSTVRFQNASIETMRIDSSGNVGIGTATPATKLDVNGTIKASGLQVPGCILQVVQAYKTDSWSNGAVINTWQDVPGLQVSITLKNSSNKVLVSGTINIGRDCNANDACIRLLRTDNSGNYISVGNSTGGYIGHVGAQTGLYTANPSTFKFLETPGQLTSTYKIQFILLGSACTGFVNIRGAQGFVVTSNLTLMEIAS